MLSALLCVIAIETSVSAAVTPKLLHFNNDLTNTYSCESPFHGKDQPYSSSVIEGSVTETRNLSVTAHLLSPGFGWVAWWDSKVAPPREYDAWMRATFGPPSHPNSTGPAIFDYVLGGGDVIGAFVHTARGIGERASISYRINDMQSCDKSPVDNYGFLSRFWYEHRHDAGIMKKGGLGFNDTCCWEQKCPCSCYDGSASMVLNNPAVFADRLSLMKELLVLYPGIDFEVDLERWVMAFDDTHTTSADRQAVMSSMMRELRATMSTGTRLGLRVPPDTALLDSIGVDLASLAADPQVRLDYATMGVSFFSFLASTSDFASVRSRVRGLPLLFELTELLSNEPTSQLLTAEMLMTVALDAYSLGADGIATFNFEYYRQIGLEPLYDALGRITDEAWVNRSSQHWFYTGRNGASQSHGGQLPLRLNASAGARMDIRLVRPTGGTYAPSGLLRLSDGGERTWPLPVGAVRVSFNSVWLTPTANTSRLYASPVPDSYNKSYAGFVVPSEVIRDGINSLVVACAATQHTHAHEAPTCDGLNVAHVELMLPVE